MNKTIIINISGIIFHIEEEAYDILRNYMSDVKKHFGSTTDSFEIVTDIENRIAEMFSEILKSTEKQVINMDDVQKIVSQMGTTEDFEDNQASIENKGINDTVKKRLYRNPDDKILGGVCSGIASYFNTDPIWARLALAVSIFFFGSGIILYLILWIIMPEAKTRTEKLAMRGESPTLENIKKSVEGEIGNIKKNASEHYQEIKSYDGVDQIRKVVSSLIEGVGKFASLIFKIIGKLLAFFVIALSCVAGFALTLTFLAVLGITNTGNVDFTWFFVSEEFQTIAYSAWYFVFMIPIIAIFLLGLRLLLNINPFNKISGLSLVGLWVISLFVGGYYAIETLSEFKEEGSLKSTMELSKSTAGIYYLVSENTLQLEEDTIKTKTFGSEGKVVVKRTLEHPIFDDVEINIERSLDNKPHIITIFNSRGKNETAALQYASNISYDFKQKDSLLIFPRNFDLKEKALWRKQSIKIKLFLPDNTSIVVSDAVDRQIRNMYNSDCYQSGAEETFWTMTKDGLRCKEIAQKDSLSN